MASRREAGAVREDGAHGHRALLYRDVQVRVERGRGRRRVQADAGDERAGIRHTDAADDRGRRRQLVRDVPHHRAGVVVGDRHVAGGVGIVGFCVVSENAANVARPDATATSPVAINAARIRVEAVHDASFTVRRGTPGRSAPSCPTYPGPASPGTHASKRERAPLARAQRDARRGPVAEPAERAAVDRPRRPARSPRSTACDRARPRRGSRAGGRRARSRFGSSPGTEPVAGSDAGVMPVPSSTRPDGLTASSPLGATTTCASAPSTPAPAGILDSVTMLAAIAMPSTNPMTRRRESIRCSRSSRSTFVVPPDTLPPTSVGWSPGGSRSRPARCPRRRAAARRSAPPT